MSVMSDNIAVQPPGRCFVPTTASVAFIGAGEPRPYPSLYWLEYGGTFKPSTSTYSFLQKWYGENTIVIRALNASGGTLAHGATVLYDSSNNVLYEADSAVAAADSGLALGVVMGMLVNETNAATTGVVTYTSPQAVPSGAAFDLVIKGLCEAGTTGSPAKGDPLVTNASGGVLKVGANTDLNPFARAMYTNVSNITLVRVNGTGVAG